jgi:hypothetical protein
MMHHREKKEHRTLLFIGQLLAWAVVCGVILMMVTGCKQDPEPAPTPVVVRASDSLPACRCGDRPWLGHEGD